jgi:high-affinity iron transporter
MLPTFVIGLREGLEAALIIGIVAAFLRQHGRADALRHVALGITLAIAACIAWAVALQIWSSGLPQIQQEALETVVGLVAVAMVSYMIVWMRSHSRGLRRDLEAATESALASGTAWALVMMAVLAVLREGFETSVFLLAAFTASDAPLAAGLGALLGILAAAGLGYGVYRGGVRINLARFFRLTGVVLVFVAAGLLATAAHTAHEAGWLAIGQAQLADLGWLAEPGSITEALLTGVLGIQPQPTVVEAVVWALYLVPMLALVLRPAGRPGTSTSGGRTEAVRATAVSADEPGPGAAVIPNQAADSLG